MADEDEIDVLGDFSLDNLLSKSESGISSCYDNSVLTTQTSEFLSCDFGIQSQWLLNDTTANSDCWYTSSANDFNTEDGNAATNTSLGFDEVICTENKTNDESGWTEEEKNSLQAGLDIFGKNSVNLSQFIGSKTAAQVKYYLSHYYTNNHNSAFNNVYNSVDINEKTVKNSQLKSEIPSVFNTSDIIEDAQIPASMEEVIAVVSTAQPTIQSVYKKPSLTRKKMSQPPKKTTKNVKFTPGQSYLSNLKKKLGRSPVRNPTNTVRKKVKTKENNVTVSEPVATTKENFISNIQPVSSGEELIKIKKENSESESDCEIDIDDADDAEKEKYVLESNKNDKELITEVKSEEETSELDLSQNESQESISNPNLQNIPESLLNILTSTDNPTSEYVLEQNEISDLEKFIHSEFFEGRPTKTPKRYLKIRNHIIDYWLEVKPSYCTKTGVRQGLKNCGDVNCIGRVHQFLEQIGAINFGCNQTNYIRPLVNMISTCQPKEKAATSHQQRVEIMRPRMKKKYNNDGEGGCTMMHDENGQIIDTTVVNQEKQKSKTNRKQNLKLVDCRSFGDGGCEAPFSVVLHISALMLMDLHAHSAAAEVMGLAGGWLHPHTNTLHISEYVACAGVRDSHSHTHCDMCPVSQSHAQQLLQARAAPPIGWFHSHPTCPPRPSTQDIHTQHNMQHYLTGTHTGTQPFVAIILSPFTPSHPHYYASRYTCLIVVDKPASDTSDTAAIPYKFQVELSSANLNVDTFLEHANMIFALESNIPKEYMIDFQKPYLDDNSMSYLDKLLASIRLHLARCGEINKMTCDAIVQGLTDICLRNTR